MVSSDVADVEGSSGCIAKSCASACAREIYVFTESAKTSMRSEAQTAPDANAKRKHTAARYLFGSETRNAIATPIGKLTAEIHPKIAASAIGPTDTASVWIRCI